MYQKVFCYTKICQNSDEKTIYDLPLSQKWMMLTGIKKALAIIKIKWVSKYYHAIILTQKNRHILICIRLLLFNI